MYLSSGDVCRILNLPYQSLQSWVRGGIVTPVIGRGGPGNHRQFLTVQVLAIALGRGLRANGLTLEAAGNAMEFVMGLTEAALEETLANGKTHLVMVGAEPADSLLSPADIAASRPLPMAKAAGAPIISIDVGKVYRNLMAQVARTEEREPVTA